MVNHFSISSLYDAPFALCARAFFLRYPNPYAGHIVSVDVLSREITADNKLRSTRLILKRGQLPKWLPKNLVEKAESWVVEESTVDPASQRLSCKSYNIDHIKLMRLIEEANFTGEKTVTHHDTKATVISNIGTSTSSWMDIGVQVMRKRIESYTIKRFQKGLHKQRAGYLHTLESIGHSSSSSSSIETPSMGYRLRKLFHIV
ncbi:hypothetical protein E3P99_02531 [Wallemia hederae]|uniref:PRELI/MSF1 domain-containing protein n=1 Tax=Wallemia hederae TaxID=1540922 RepID=A0A4T0FLC4_9BASI|nr:hypothetical protein E3P99_02531 [Wallemia hederae]